MYGYNSTGQEKIKYNTQCHSKIYIYNNKQSAVIMIDY